MLSKSTFVNEMRQEDALTDNGALTNSTSLSSVLDLFFVSGACRKESEKKIKSLIERALVENKELALKCIFWAGDIRGGAGERRFFKIAIKHLYDNHNEIFKSIYSLIPEYSRWDVLFDFADSLIVVDYIKKEYDDNNSLLLKWLPRKRLYNNFGSAFRKCFKISSKDYRKTLVEGTKVVESNLCAKQYDFDYSQVPSVAFKKYNKAFRRNDEDRFSSFLEKVESGEKKINASVLFPHDLYKSYQNSGDQEAIKQQWNCLPNYVENSECRFLPVCDVSGSMTGDPMAISVALGCYLSERNKSVFKDAWVTFSRSPKMQYLTGDIISRFQQMDLGIIDNTNLQAVFDLILSKAIGGKVSKDDMPTHILLISDMEFDSACDSRTNFDVIKQKYLDAGFEMPGIVFWNVNGRVGNSPVSVRDKNTALISGASPQIVKSVISGELEPMKVMLKTLGDERYSDVKI